jgi:hypothetical protein
VQRVRGLRREEGLNLLASWSVTLDQEDAAHAAWT